MKEKVKMLINEIKKDFFSDMFFIGSGLFVGKIVKELIK